MCCKYCDDYSGICFNPDSPMRADVCPVPDVEGVCKYEEREEDVYVLTPNGCAAVALQETGLIESVDDDRFDVFWEKFTELMQRYGYVHAEADGSDHEEGKTE